MLIIEVKYGFNSENQKIIIFASTLTNNAYILFVHLKLTNQRLMIFFFLVFYIFQKFQLECYHTTKMSICCKFHENLMKNKVVGTNGLTINAYC
jgi:hypothetical protein